MADLTRFDFHALRFNKSEAVQSMSAEEVGQYILLLVEAWLANKETSLPDDPKLLARFARVNSVSKQVLEMFPVVQTQWGQRRRNETLYGEWRAANERLDLAKEYGRRGGEAKKEASRVPTGTLETLSRKYLPNPNQTEPNQFDSNQIRPESATFKNIAIQYGSFFGGHHSHGKKHLERYQTACSKYGEDKVLEYFKRWAEGSSWLREKRDPNGLNFFWKPLEEMAEGDALREDREQQTKKTETLAREEISSLIEQDSKNRTANIQKELAQIEEDKKQAAATRYEI